MKRVSFGKSFSEESLLQKISTTSKMHIFVSFIIVIIIIIGSSSSNSNSSRDSTGGGGGGSSSSSSSNNNKIQIMSNLNTKVIPVIIRQLEPSQNHSESTWATYRENTKSRNYKTVILGTADVHGKVVT